MSTIVETTREMENVRKDASVPIDTLISVKLMQPMIHNPNQNKNAQQHLAKRERQKPKRKVKQLRRI